MQQQYCQDQRSCTPAQLWFCKVFIAILCKCLLTCAWQSPLRDAVTMLYISTWTSSTGDACDAIRSTPTDTAPMEESQAHLGELALGIELEAGSRVVHGAHDQRGEGGLRVRHAPRRQLQQHNAEGPQVR